MKNKKKQETIEQSFWRDFEKIRKKYPMVYLDCLCPDDFQDRIDALERDKYSDEEVELSAVDWNDQVYKDIASVIERRWASTIGVNWDFIDWVIGELNKCKMKT